MESWRLAHKETMNNAMESCSHDMPKKVIVIMAGDETLDFIANPIPLPAKSKEDTDL
jgi:hypothetical protein